MLDHLVNFEFAEGAGVPPGYIPLANATPSELVTAQHTTAEWLTELGAPDSDDVVRSQQVIAAREAFAAMTGGQAPNEAQNRALLNVKTPAAVRHVTGMLAAYDWDYVEQVKELRGYVVARLVEESKNPDGRIRMRALEQLGKITEVGLFTDRIEIKKTTVSDADLDNKIREKIDRLGKLHNISAAVAAGHVDILDVDSKEVPPDPAPVPPESQNGNETGISGNETGTNPPAPDVP